MATAREHGASDRISSTQRRFRRLATGVAGSLAAAVLTLTGTSPCSAQRAAPGHLGGPGSVHAQVAEDKEARQQPGPALPRVPLRDRLEREFGLVLGADYNVLFQHVSERPGSNEAASGVARIYGHWTPFDRTSWGAGMLVFKGEHRHRLGTSLTPVELGPASGFAGLTAITFSDAGALLTNLYWAQAFADNRLALAAGIVDVTDYVDVYGLVNPWTDFLNLACSTNPTLPAPSQGLGVALLWRATPNFYLLGGVADANGDPHDPADSFRSFFGDHELFSHLEFGWIESWAERFADNAHVTAWHVDDRAEAGIEGGWGLTLSLSWTFADRWTPFLRAGYADGGGAPVDRAVSTGLAYRVNKRGDTVALGAHWGRPPRDATEGRETDQWAFEAYYRLQLLPQVALTPNLQLIVNPALAPEQDEIWVLGLRTRLTF